MLEAMEVDGQVDGLMQGYIRNDKLIPRGGLEVHPLKGMTKKKNLVKDSEK